MFIRLRLFITQCLDSYFGEGAEKVMEQEVRSDTNQSERHRNNLIKKLGELHIQGRIETVKTTALLRSAYCSRK